MLKDLNLREKSSRIFLESKSDFIRREISTIQSAGDPKVYTNKIASIVFGTILKTCDKFNKLFEDEPTSEFLKWLVKELEIFCDHIRNSVFYLNNGDLKIVAETTAIACRYSNKLIKKGISVTYIIQENLRKDLEKTMKLHMNTKQDLMTNLIVQETWNSSK